MMGEGAISTYVLEWQLEGTCGTVHSVFRSSLNVHVAGFLLHIGGTNDSLSCLGMSIPEPDLRALLERARRKDLVVFGRGFFRVYSVGGVTKVEYGSFEKISCALGDPIGDHLLAGLVGPLTDLDLDSRLGLEKDERLCSAFRILAEDTPGEDGMTTSILFLLGRGQGLTPSGDDFLVGYGVARWLRGRQHPFVDVLSSLLDGQTTDVSLAYLRAVIAGVANPGYCELAQAVRKEERSKYADLLSRLQEVGHTSGKDGLKGLMVGLGAL